MTIGKAETDKMISMLSDEQTAKKFVDGLVEMHADNFCIQDGTVTKDVQASYRTSVEGFAPYVDSNQFTAGQLQVIRYGLECGLDVTSYADASLSLDEMYKRFYQLKMELCKV